MVFHHKDPENETTTRTLKRGNAGHNLYRMLTEMNTGSPIFHCSSVRCCNLGQSLGSSHTVFILILIMISGVGKLQPSSSK